VPASSVPSRLAAAAFAVVAFFHAAALVLPEIDPSPAWRHALFTGINGAYAMAFATRPRWLILAFLPLAAQQAASHGSSFVRALSAGTLDWKSAIVLAALPALAWVAYGARGAGPRPQE
jgi:hypothetical protein